MALIDINGDLIIDETQSLQADPLVEDDGTESPTDGSFSGLSADFIAALAGLGIVGSAYADDMEIGNSASNYHENDGDLINGEAFVTVDPEGSSITNLYFSDTNGDPLDGDQVVGLTTIDGEDVFLWSISDNMVIATTGDVNATVVAAFYLNTSGDNLSAEIEMVTFEPFTHTNDGDPDDRFDFTDVLNVSVDGSLSFDFSNLDSGNFLHVSVGDSDAAVMVSGRNVVVDPDGSMDSTSDSYNTSQGGQGATGGINNQMYSTPSGNKTIENTGVYTFVVGQSFPAGEDNGTYTDVDDMDYTGFLDVKDAQVFVSQTQGNATLSMQIDVWTAGTAGAGDDAAGISYVDNTGDDGAIGDYSDDYQGDPDPAILNANDALEDDVPTDVQYMEVIRDGVVIYRDYRLSDGNDFDDTGGAISVTWDDGNTFTVTGFEELDSIKWYTDDPNTLADETFNRFWITAKGGKFDIGQIDVSEGITETTPVGDHLFVDDDGPMAVITDAGLEVIHDETPGVDGPNDQGGGVPGAFAAITDTAIGWAQSTGPVVTSTGTDYGADGPAAAPDDEVWSLDVASAGVDSGLDATGGGDILLYKEGDLVVGRVGGETGDIAFAISMDAGAVLSVVQYLAIDHPNDADPDDSVTLDDAALLAVLDVEDGDGDGDQATLAIGDMVHFEDDGPTAQINDAGLEVIHDETPGVDGPNDQGGGVPGAFAAITDTAIGWAQSTGPVVTSTGTDYGADGPAAAPDDEVWSLDVASAGVDSGLDATGGGDILLYKEGDLVVGRVGGETGDIAFAISMDAGAVLSVVQYLAIDHPNDADPDDSVALDDAALLAVLDIEDGDGDGDTATLAIGDMVHFEDDGPSANVTITGVTVTHDESLGIQNGGIPTPSEDNDDDDQAGAAPTVFTDLATQESATLRGWAMSAAAVVNSTGSEFGTDGAGASDPAVWSLAVGATNDTGLTDLAGNAILLSAETINGEEVIVGWADVEGDGLDGDDDVLALAITINPDGSLNLAQYIPIKHPDQDDPDDAVALATNSLSAVLTISDGDDDSHQASAYIGDKVIIEDDGPDSGQLDPEHLEEDDLDTALSVGINEDGSVDAHTATSSIDATTFISGFDGPGTFNLFEDTEVDPNDVLPVLFSNGEQVTYTTTLDIDASGTDRIEAWAGGRLIFTFTLTQTGPTTADATLTLNDQLDHVDGNGENLALVVDTTGDGIPDDFVTLIDFTELMDWRDADGDAVNLPNDYVSFDVEDDIPALTDQTVSNSVDEDDLPAGTDTTKEALTVNGDLGALVDPGTDEDLVWTLLADTSALTALGLTSQGQALSYLVSGDTLTASTAAGTVFTLTLNGDGTYSFTLAAQLDHAAGAGENSIVLDLSSVVQATDFDDDSIGLAANDFTISVVDDVPAIGPISNSLIDYFDGSTTGPVTLNGVVGADENLSDAASDGTMTYTFSSFTVDTSVVGDLQGQLVDDDTRVVYYVDGAGGSDNVYDAAFDTLYYDVTLDQTNGTYEFEVYQDPVPPLLEFSFDGFPSGKQIYGVFSSVSGGPDGFSLLVFATGVNVVNSGNKLGEAVNGKDAGNFVNSSNAQSSGTALAVNNQEIGEGQALSFAYLDDPYSLITSPTFDINDIVVGQGTSSELNTAYADAGYLGFNGMIEVSTAEVQIAQVTPSGNLVDMRISAYDVDDGDETSTSEADAINFLEEGYSAVQRDIISVSVKDASGTVIYTRTQAEGNDDDGIGIDVLFDGLSVDVQNLADDYSVEFTTDGDHDLATIENVDMDGDRFDIGGYFISEAQPTPDQLFEFGVDVFDYDLDSANSTFNVAIDGTGIFDDGVYDLNPV
ncbi:hypothetical protein K3X44_07905 [Aliiroseovarius crassostreae]|uniref:DUF5801 repeats-in-toxin domain-containing protein n=1 Tax=Aliiroseovarius crassostreae TaxID=154981 RepID=UPI0021FB6BDE|nr:DUF5801 repeats-in-toxin domain-containing protein [Aliiroseovarius crassostreae]UWQ00477.1 hypothetical protein K3X44_07905 [Aliiroseovarius crassostreae]